MECYCAFENGDAPIFRRTFGKKRNAGAGIELGEEALASDVDWVLGSEFAATAQHGEIAVDLDRLYRHILEEEADVAFFANVLDLFAHAQSKEFVDVVVHLG